MENIDELIDLMTESGHPKKQGSIQLGFEIDHDCTCDTCNCDESDDNGDLEFEVLSTIALKLMRRLFGENITPDKLSENDFIKLQTYFMSIGYKINYKVDTTETNSTYRISFEVFYPDNT